MVLCVHNVFKIATYPFIGFYFIIYLFTKGIYNIVKYLYIGVEYILYISYNKLLKYIAFGFIYICIFIKNIFKYAFYAVKIPFKLLIKPKEKKEIIDNNKPVEEPISFEDNTNIEEATSNDDVLTFEEENPTDTEPELVEEEKPASEADNFLINFIKTKNEKYYKNDKSFTTPAPTIEEVLSFEEEKPEDKNIINDSDVYLNKNIKIEKVSLWKKISGIFAGFFGRFSKKSDKMFKNNIFAKNRRNKRDMNQQALLIDFEGADAVKSSKKVLYQYIARDKNGKIIKDYFDAYSKVEVHSYLLSEGYEVYSIKTNKWIQVMHAGTNTSKTKFKNKDLIFFLTQLSTYLKAGIPLVEALRIISRQYKKKKYANIFKSVIYELSIGESLSSGMEKQGNAFPRLLINMVKTAEMTGSLPEVLDDMAEYYTEAEATRKQMITAMTYPSIVLVFSVGVMVFVMIYVVPKFVEIYDTMETELPGITKFILGLSHFLTHYWYLVILGLVLLIVMIIYSYKKIKGFRTAVQYMIMKMPIFKNVVIYNEVTMFTKTFSSLLAHNVPITDSMEILNKITNNEIYKMLILDTITNLARGGKISDAFKDHWAFPLPAYEMIVTGEATGELAEMMHKVSIYYQDLHKNAVTRIKTFIEPALTVFLTLGVGVILLSIIIPMFNMYSAVQGME